MRAMLWSLGPIRTAFTSGCRAQKFLWRRRCRNHGPCIRLQGQAVPWLKNHCGRSAWMPGRAWGHSTCVRASKWTKSLDFCETQRWRFRRVFDIGHRVDCRVANIWTTPVPLDGLNGQDEVFPQWDGQDIRFASNREGPFALYRARAALRPPEGRTRSRCLLCCGRCRAPLQ